MNKKYLIQAICEHASDTLTHKQVDCMLNHLATVIYEQLANDESVMLPGIGKFSVTERAARRGRNPRTGEDILIPAARVPKFKAVKAFKDGIV